MQTDPHRDPRTALTNDELREASLRSAPDIARPSGAGDGLGLAAGALGALALGALTLLTLSRERTPSEPTAAAPAPAPTPAPAPAPPPRPVVAAAPLIPALPSVAPAISTPVAQPAAPTGSRSMPLAFDNTDPGARPAPAGPLIQATAGGPPALSADEQFAARVGGDAQVARASAASDKRYTVMQGTILPAVLETALNSDLPGYARALISRDVKSFDGGRIVIPRGSRLIGQYKSGLSTGQSRAFVIWSRLIRPDGVSINLGSPVMDETGEVGLGGKVDRHFLQRFGAAFLLSAVSGVSSAVAGGSASTFIIGTSSEAQSAASQAVQADGRIQPTIRVPQGTPIQVFTARDLDFSGT